MNSFPVYGDPVVICPYNKSHKIAKSRIQTHIVKCEKNYPEGYKEACPYDATHRVFKHELQEHIQTCPLRRLLKPELYQFVRKRGADMQDFISQSDVESTLDLGETWDEPSSTSFSRTIDRDSVIGSTIAGSENNFECHGNQHPTTNNADQSGAENLRLPRGFSEAMMIAVDSDKNETFDTESVCSAMCIGRGNRR